MWNQCVTGPMRPPAETPPRTVHVKQSEPCRPCSTVNHSLITAWHTHTHTHTHTHSQCSKTTRDMQSHLPSRFSLRGDNKEAGMNCWQRWKGGERAKRVKWEWQGAQDVKEMRRLCNLRAGEERQNNIPRHVRIKKLSAKAKNNNILLVDCRERNVSIHIYLGATEQRPHLTTTGPGAEPSSHKYWLPRQQQDKCWGLNNRKGPAPRSKKGRSSGAAGQCCAVALD